jgi:hypothetical protein
VLVFGVFPLFDGIIALFGAVPAAELRQPWWPLGRGGDAPGGPSWQHCPWNRRRAQELMRHGHVRGKLVLTVP